MTVGQDPIEWPIMEKVLRLGENKHIYLDWGHTDGWNVTGKENPTLWYSLSMTYIFTHIYLYKPVFVLV